MSRLTKLPLLLETVSKNPSELLDRVKTVLEVRWDHVGKAPCLYETLRRAEAISILEDSLGKDLAPFLEDTVLLELEGQISNRVAALAAKAPFTLAHNGDVELARFCYAVSRALRPKVVLETGVAYGVTTACILQAIELNGLGGLWSIDLPPLGKRAEDHIGFLVPGRLKQPWHLRRGTTKRLLPTVLASLGQVDIFIQDSLHTYSTITNEIKTAWPFLRRGGVVIADDIQGNAAFRDLAGRLNPAGSVVVQELHKDSMFGVLIK